jgi:hypothetical protein
MYKETRIENKDWYQVAGNCRKMKNRVSKNGGKSAKSRRDTTPFLMDLLVAFPGKNTAKFGVQNRVVAPETARKSRRNEPEILVWLRFWRANRRLAVIRESLMGK